MTSEPIAAIDVLIVTLPRDVPYLGALGPGEAVNSRGYIVRKGNGTIYPTVDRSVVVRVRTKSGLEGWGETYGLCAPRATGEIITDIFAPHLMGADALRAAALWDELYGLMRVRGYTGGFYCDALAAVDIALWDIAGQRAGVPLYALLGGAKRQRIPAYVSGLPADDISARVAMAQDWRAKGFGDVKFAAVVSHQGVGEEFRALRAALGPQARIAVDLHWKYTPAEAIRLARSLEADDPWFLEAPVKPEDPEALAAVRRSTPVPIAAGEEWRTDFDALFRIRQNAVDLIQPEMGHTGVTQFMRMAHLAELYQIGVAPHATIGVGVFMAASLHAAAAVGPLITHEYQHSIYDKNAQYLSGMPRCAEGAFDLPPGPGLGVTPDTALFDFAEQLP